MGKTSSKVRKVDGLVTKMWLSAKRKNDANILNLLDANPKAIILDLGCDNGIWTKKIANKIKSSNIHGIDIVNERLAKAKKLGIQTKKSDINFNLPYENNFFDVIHANQVIEHLTNIDLFINEIYRILKPGGYVLISTENISAWDNIFALMLGYQAFSQHISSKWHLGNKLSPHHNKKINLSSWSHKIIFSHFGLKDILKKYKFKKIKIVGSGHFPFPNFFDYIDPIHCHFITAKAYKK